MICTGESGKQTKCLILILAFNKNGAGRSEGIFPNRCTFISKSTTISLAIKDSEALYSTYAVCQTQVTIFLSSLFLFTLVYECCT